MVSLVKKLPEKLYKRIYSLVPRLCVDVIIRSTDGIVLVKRDIPPCKGMWHIPGGTVLLGESLGQAVKRVAKDETNLEIEINQPLQVKEYSKESAFGQVVSIVYLADAISGYLKGNGYGEEVKAFKVIPAETILEQIQLIKKALSIDCSI